MSGPKWLLLLLVLATGCTTTRTKLTSGRSADELEGAAAVRARSDDDAGEERLSEQAGEPAGTAVVQAGGIGEENRVTPVVSRTMDEQGADSRPNLDEIDDAQIVATVNGSPIFAAEVLWSHRMELAQAKRQLSAEQYDQYRLQLIATDLPARIQNKVLVQGIKQPLKKEQVEQLEQQLEPIVEAELARMMKGAKVETVEQLAELMARQGASLELWRKDFCDVVLAGQYLREKVESEQTPIDRQALLTYYEEHRDEYAKTARVRWQQLRITFARHGGKTKAFDVLNQAVEALRSGVDFATVAKKYSDGPHAADGGHWDWTSAGSLANAEIEKALFTTPVGQISQIYTFDDEFEIVRVVEREEAGHTSFEEVQSEIRESLKKQAELAARERIVKELLERAAIETIFDGMANEAAEFAK